MIVVTAALALLGATTAAASVCDPTAKGATISGKWKDSRTDRGHAVEWTLTEDRERTSFTCHGPWPGTPTGHLYANGSVTVIFSPTNTAVGQFSNSANCDFITWTDPPDKAAGNKWCKVGTKACRTPAPPAPPPAPAPAPNVSYPALSGGAFSGAAAPASPDPLVAYRWGDAAINAQQYQEYRRQPLRVLPDAPSADASSGGSGSDSPFSGANTLLSDSGVPGSMVVSGAGSVGFDFGLECGGWFDFDSPDLAEQLQSKKVEVLLSSSEFTQPQFTSGTSSNNHGNCTLPARAVPGVTGRYQLAINPELYEGLRYGWLHARPAAAAAAAAAATGPAATEADTAAVTVGAERVFKFTVTNFTAVCQVIPMNYVDHAFEANGTTATTTAAGVTAAAVPGAGAATLNEVWYTAIYTTRVATIRYAGSAGFGSILMDRGDRISWTGDAHLAQKAALAGFGGDFGSMVVQKNTERTKNVDNGIISYDMYFILSAVDYFMHTGDTASLASWAPVIEKKFAVAVAFWAKTSVQVRDTACLFQFPSHLSRACLDKPYVFMRNLKQTNHVCPVFRRASTGATLVSEPISSTPLPQRLRKRATTRCCQSKQCESTQRWRLCVVRTETHTQSFVVIGGSFVL
jgi:hypothetical protein